MNDPASFTRPGSEHASAYGPLVRRVFTQPRHSIYKASTGLPAEATAS